MKRDQQVHFPRFFGILLLLGGAGILSLTLVFEAWWGRLICVGASAAVLLLAAAILRFRIVYDAEKFIYVTWLKKQTFRYADIDASRFGLGEYVFFIGSKKVRVDTVIPGALTFWFFANDRYREAHDGEEIPESNLPSRDIFKGNSIDGGVSFLIGYGISLLFAIAMVFAIVYQAIKAEENTILLPALSILLLLALLLYGIMAIRVGRNPKKYGKKKVLRFFKAGYIDIEED